MRIGLPTRWGVRFTEALKRQERSARMKGPGSQRWARSTISAVFILVAALTASNSHASIIASGFIITGFGEWINHPYTTTITPHYKYSVRNRETSKPGWTIDIIGGCVVVIGVVRLFLCETRLGGWVTPLARACF
jgi:hypothetical protein